MDALVTADMAFLGSFIILFANLFPCTLKVGSIEVNIESERGLLSTVSLMSVAALTLLCDAVPRL